MLLQRQNQKVFDESEKDDDFNSSQDSIDFSKVHMHNLHSDEVDEDEPDEKLESQVKVTQETLNSMQKVMEAIEPIIHDLKDGSL